DEKMHKIGQVLTVPKSRKIYSILIEQQLNAKEIAKLVENETNPRLPIIKYHLEKMVEAGLIVIEIKQQRKKGHYLKYYKAIPNVLIVPPKFFAEISTKKTLNKKFKNIFKLVAAGFALGSSILIFEIYFFWNIYQSVKTQLTLRIIPKWAII
ncbi:MAG: winged helix-turn-helix domain-containing protein, partial [Candidatus Neomarinimicrobiota bacterium]